MEPIELRRRARIAYELSRLRAAVPGAAAALALGALATASGRPLGPVSAGSIPLAALAVALLFRGRAAGRAVWPALVSGSFATILPLAAVAFCPPALCHIACLLACVVGGGAAGASIAAFAARDADGREFLLAGLCVAALAGSLGCLLAGAIGIAAMLAGALGVGAPVWALAHARR